MDLQQLNSTSYGGSPTSNDHRHLTFFAQRRLTSHGRFLLPPHNNANLVLLHQHSLANSLSTILYISEPESVF